MTIDIIGPEAEALLSWDGLTTAIEAGHRLPRAEIADIFLYRGKDTLLSRAAWIDGLGQLVKTCTIFPGNAEAGLPTINGTVTLYADQGGLPEALIDFHLVTKWKTAGDSLLAAKRLARRDSREIVIVGAGNVSRAMIAAYSSLFHDARFTVWNRSPDKARAMEGPRVQATEDLEAAVRKADIVCTATMSHDPVVKGAWLKPGTHLDLIGAFRPDMREVDDEALRRATIFVDSRATTIGHIGEIRDPIARGVISEADIRADYYDIRSGAHVRSSDDEITISKNGGGAHLDLMTAAYIAAMWRMR